MLCFGRLAECMYTPDAAQETTTFSTCYFNFFLSIKCNENGLISAFQQLFLPCYLHFLLKFLCLKLFFSVIDRNVFEMTEKV